MEMSQRNKELSRSSSWKMEDTMNEEYTTKPFSYSITGGTFMPELVRDPPGPMRYLVIPIPEGPENTLHRLELKYHEHEGFCYILIKHLKSGVFFALLMGFLTSVILYVMSEAMSTSIDSGGSSNITNLTTEITRITSTTGNAAIT